MIDSIIQFFLNKDTKFRYKVFTGVIVIGLVILINNLTGFTFYLNNQERLTELEYISKLKSDSTLSLESRNTILNIEQKINERKNIQEKISTLISSIKIRDTSDVNNGQIPSRNNLLLFILSSWLGMLLPILTIIGGISAIRKDYKGESTLILFIILSMLFGTGVISLLVYYLIGLIPMIGNSWTINYIIAGVFQPLIIGIYFFYKKWIKKKDN